MGYLNSLDEVRRKELNVTVNFLLVIIWLGLILFLFEQGVILSSAGSFLVKMGENSKVQI